MGTHCSILVQDNLMDRGAWLATVHGITKSGTWMRTFTFAFHFCCSNIDCGWRPGSLRKQNKQKVKFEGYYENPRRRQWHPTPVLLPGKSHGWRSLVGCGPWGRYQSDTTERRHFHFSLSHIGEGNGNPLQCSCLENPGDGEPGRLPAMGSHRVGHDWSDLAAAAATWEAKWKQWWLWHGGCPESDKKWKILELILRTKKNS